MNSILKLIAKRDQTENILQKGFYTKTIEEKTLKVVEKLLKEEKERKERETL